MSNLGIDRIGICVRERPGKRTHICLSQWSYTDLQQESHHIRELAAIKNNSQALQIALHCGKMFP